ncbi:unnamed protein product [Brassicogethes aeneus]|uniref:Uncharacterized protein n=1 Tax=Brassicogethes aeneus TaxID=1431903 RepID=A0A9P0FBD6_BRAAE|nr:unnamed protein product [Brassicogethes aeneus]
MMVGTLMRYSFIMRDDKNSSLSDTMKMGPFANANPDTRKTSKPSDEEPELIIPFNRLLKISPDLTSNKENEENQPTNGQKVATEESRTAVDENRNGKSCKECKEQQQKEGGNGKTSTTDSRSSALTMFSTNDDFIMKTPFTSTNANTELGKFYRECQTAPPLMEFAELPPLAELDVTKQLETFESDLNEYDNIVQSLCQSPNNN